MKVHLTGKLVGKILTSDVVKLVRIVLAAWGYSGVPDRVEVHARSARTRVGIVGDKRHRLSLLHAFINPKQDRSQWAEVALITLMRAYTPMTDRSAPVAKLRELLAAWREVEGSWPEPAPRKRRDPTLSEKLAEMESRVEHWENTLKKAVTAQRLARTKLKGYRAKARHLRSKLSTAETRELSETDFAARMKLRRETGKLRDLGAA